MDTGPKGDSYDLGCPILSALCLIELTLYALLTNPSNCTPIRKAREDLQREGEVVRLRHLSIVLKSGGTTTRSSLHYLGLAIFFPLSSLQQVIVLALMFNAKWWNLGVAAAVAFAVAAARVYTNYL